MKQVVVTVDAESDWRHSEEAYVRIGEPTIYLCSDLRHWANLEQKFGWDVIMTSVISHETLHTVLSDIGEEQASEDLDILFNKGGGDYAEDYHGLCRFEEFFKPMPKRFRIRRWKR